MCKRRSLGFTYQKSRTRDSFALETTGGTGNSTKNWWDSVKWKQKSKHYIVLTIICSAYDRLTCRWAHQYWTCQNAWHLSESLQDQTHYQICGKPSNMQDGSILAIHHDKEQAVHSAGLPDLRKSQGFMTITYDLTDFLVLSLFGGFLYKDPRLKNLEHPLWGFLVKVKWERPKWCNIVTRWSRWKSSSL